MWGCGQPNAATDRSWWGRIMRHRPPPFRDLLHGQEASRVSRLGRPYRIDQEPHSDPSAIVLTVADIAPRP